MSNIPRNILLVEPEPVLAEVTAFRLELLGYRMTCVNSAEQALAQVELAIPDLLITDLVLPALDGMGLIERLTTDEATSDLPIMVLSVDADLSQVQQVYQVGAKDFLVVPFHLEVLEEKVAKLLADAPVRTTENKSEEAVAAK
jgi:CheY-like chemotaxis protein